MKCAVANCNSTNNSKASEMSFFLFPTDATIQKHWLNFCGRGNKINPRTSYVCMLHFNPDDVENSIQYEMGFAKKRLLKRGTVPSKKSDVFENKELCEERASRIKQRENKKMVAEILQEYDNKSTEQIKKENEANDVNEPGNYESIVKINNTNNILTNLNTEDVKSLKAKLQTLQNENRVLKRHNKMQCSKLRSLEQQLLALKTLYKKDVIKMKRQVIKANCELENIEQKLLIIFTRGQILKLKNGMKRRVWTEEDIMQSKYLYATSSKLYKFLYRKKFPLPSVRTLQNRTQKVNINKGLLQPVLKVLSASNHMSSIQKLCLT